MSFQGHLDHFTFVAPDGRELPLSPLEVEWQPGTRPELRFATDPSTARLLLDDAWFQLRPGTFEEGPGTAFDPDEPVEFRLEPDPEVMVRFGPEADLLDLLMELSTAEVDDPLRQPDGWRATTVVQSMFEGAVKVGFKTVWAEA